MSGYSVVALGDIISEIGEDFCRKILSVFSCPYNVDVEKFLTHRSAIDFSKQNISKTFLVYASYKKENVLCGYFAIANKYIVVPRKALSKTSAKRIGKFAIGKPDNNAFVITSPLIAQLGKNYTCGYNKLITGDELLKLALDKIREAQRILGGKTAYVECEDIGYIINFYTDNGFVYIGKRLLDKDEQGDNKGLELIQLLKYFAE